MELVNMEIKDKIQICKVVAQAILADAQITDSERDLLNTLMARFELNPDQKEEVLARNIEDNPAEMAKEITSFESQNQLLIELALAVAVDGEISPPERALLNKVAKELGVNTEDLDTMLKAAIS